MRTFSFVRHLFIATSCLFAASASCQQTIPANATLVTVERANAQVADELSGPALPFCHSRY